MHLAVRRVLGRFSSSNLKSTPKNLRQSRIAGGAPKPRSLVSSFASRSYCGASQQSEVSKWSKEDLALLGTYSGTPTPRGLKKTTTGLTSLEVQQDGREILIALYKKIAAEVSKLPPTFAYRIDNEIRIQQRLEVLNSETDILRIEEEFDDGQIETLIEEAKAELENTLPLLLEMKPWEETQSKWDSVPHLYSNTPSI